MKRAERHHLKANPVALFIARVQEVFREYGSAVVIGVGAIFTVLLGFGGYIWWQQWQSGRASELLAEAMAIATAPIVVPTALTTEEVEGNPAASSSAKPAPFVQPPESYSSEIARLEAAVPMLLSAADAYPSSLPGITARYQAAAGLVSLGRTEEAVEQYKEIISVAGDWIYGRMATLGLADTRLLTGNYQAAITLLEGETAVVGSNLPIDAVLMRLGRAYRLAGRDGDALAAFTRVVEEFSDSLYFIDAQREAETLRREAMVSGA